MSNKLLLTKEHRRFVEICNECKQFKYIAICYGFPGVGKTFSARQYTQWDLIEKIMPPYHLSNPLPVEDISKCDSVFYTAPVTSSPAKIERDICSICTNLSMVIGDIAPPKKDKKKWAWDKENNYTKLIIIDEADRLSKTCLEQIRDIYDKTHIGVVLIGIPGLQKKLLRHSQFYSRVGFTYHFESIKNDEDLDDVLKYKWKDLGLTYNPENKADKECTSEIRLMTRGNFRLIERLFIQIEFIMRINNYYVIDKEVIKTARENLLIGVDE